MSADNGIYIAKFPDGHRISFTTNIEDVQHFPESSNERKNVLKNYFGVSKLYSSKEEAYTEAQKMYDDFMNDPDNLCPIIEYGICYIGEFEDFNIM